MFAVDSFTSYFWATCLAILLRHPLSLPQSSYLWFVDASAALVNNNNFNSICPQCKTTCMHFKYLTEIAQDFLRVMEKCPNRLKRKINTVTNLKARNLSLFFLVFAFIRCQPHCVFVLFFPTLIVSIGFHVKGLNL